MTQRTTTPIEREALYWLDRHMKDRPIPDFDAMIDLLGITRDNCKYLHAIWLENKGGRYNLITLNG